MLKKKKKKSSLTLAKIRKEGPYMEKYKGFICVHMCVCVCVCVCV